jgi:2-polyprenyl-6-methoxyphenol hydroxylase-like FAD-dependent oxidoreductase
VAAHLDSCDVLVIGGRIAGALTAAGFAQRGHRVLLVDKVAFPSPTLSAHYFRGHGVLRTVEELGWLDLVLGLGAPPLTCEYVYANGSPSAHLRPASDAGTIPYALSVRRVALDHALLSAAGDLSEVQVRTSCPPIELLWDGERVVGAILEDGTELSARLVVGADGRQSWVAAQVGAADRQRHPGSRAMYYHYVEAFEPPAGSTQRGAEFSFLGDELACAFPSDAGMTCVALSVNRSVYDRVRNDAATSFDALLTRHRGLWPRVRAAQSDGRLLCAPPAPNVIRQPAGVGWALVGDAAMYQDPWSAAGMDCAAVAARLLVDTVTSAWNDRRDDWATTYERRCDEALRATFTRTVTYGRDLSTLVP